MNNKYFYIKSDNGFNDKTNPVLNNYISTFTPIHIDEKNVDEMLDKHNKHNNILVLYSHNNKSILKSQIINYLNNTKNVKFKFYLFTFDFWGACVDKIHFHPKNFKNICFANNIDELINFINPYVKNYKNNFIFKNHWCCYNECFLEFNHNPIYNLLISGNTSTTYTERHFLTTFDNEKLYVRPRSTNDIKSTKFIYNKCLNSYFACFSSSIYFVKGGYKPNRKLAAIGGKLVNTHAILLKTFEILGSGSLLVMPLKEEKYIGEIGLVNMKNCYLMDFSKDLNPQINYIFDNIELFNKIRKEGHVHAKNNLNEQKMIEEIKQIIEQ